MILLRRADRRGCSIRDDLSVVGNGRQRQAKIVGMHVPERQDELQRERYKPGPRPPWPMGPDEPRGHAGI